LSSRKEYVKVFQIGLVAVISVAAIIVSVYFIFQRWEKKLIEEKEDICIYYAEYIAMQVEGNENLQLQLSELADADTIFMDHSRKIEDSLTRIVQSNVSDIPGLEGGFYILGLNDFIGYAYPTSPPPIPVYGPPPRSYNIIKNQAIKSIERNEPIVDVHAFDPAVFPLATHPVRKGQKVLGSVWVRVHIERDLPVAKLKRILNLLTIISLVGFVVMAMFSLFLRNGIRNIRKELDNTRKDPGYRLKHRGGWFGFIPRSINGMLDLIEREYSQRDKLEKELQQKDKLASMGKMLAGIAHEVKTPLSVIKMRMQMWQSEVTKNEKLQEKVDAESVNMIINEINRLSDLVKRLLVFSRPIHENLKPTSIDRTIEEVIGMMDFNCSDKEIRISKKLKANPPLVNADNNSLKQVLINLYTNSIESIQGSGEIRTETSYHTKESEMTIRISDTGQGIAEDKMNKVFDPFFSTKEHGTGLGLAISREIIKAHGGNISFGKNSEKGTVCVVTLPLIDK